ncbi:MAG TPA: Ger(x)C family spore germination protein [Desulfobacteria bacterium]|nr:Ger(x)C family spore germination protein [Desulfobacteria bacterium]
MRKLILVIMVLSLLLLTGCWDYRELDQLAIVYAVGFDRVPGNKPILITLQTVTLAGAQGPGGGGGGGGGGSDSSGGGEQKTYTRITGEGKSFFDVLSKLGREVPRGIYLADAKIIVLGKDFAETGIGDILDSVYRYPEIRKTTLVLAADRTANEILGKGALLEPQPAKGLEMILEKTETDAFVPLVHFYEFIAQIKSETGVSFVPFLELVKDPGSEPDSGTKDNLTIRRTAIFKSQRQVGILNQAESQAFMWLLDKMKGEAILLDNGSGGEQKGPIALRILAGRTTITPEVSEDGIMIHINCSGKAALNEAEAAGLDLRDPETVKQVARQASKAVKGQIEHTIHKAQTELNADFVGFGERLHDQYPTKWKQVKDNWDEVFPTVSYEVTCNIEIVSFGLINDPIQFSDPKE